MCVLVFVPLKNVRVWFRKILREQVYGMLRDCIYFISDEQACNMENLILWHTARHHDSEKCDALGTFPEHYFTILFPHHSFSESTEYSRLDSSSHLSDEKTLSWAGIKSSLMQRGDSLEKTDAG